MARSPVRRPYRSASARIRPSWTYFQSLIAPVANLTKVLVVGFQPSNPSVEETILRTRIELFIVSDQLAVAEFQQGAFGLYVVSDLAFAAGAASIPSPVTDGSDDGWFVHQTFIGESSQAVEAGWNGMRYTIDSKAMRKVPEGSIAAVVIENTSILNALQFGVGIRMLSKITQG